MEPRSRILDFFPPPAASLAAPDFLGGGGEMGERIRASDWSGTALGAARDWPQGLRTAVRIMLGSRQPVSIWWGMELGVLYNDACRALVGGNHPAALGQTAPAAWREIWEDIGPRVAGAIRGNDENAAKPVPLLVERHHGRVEEAHYTITFTALPGEAAAAGGLLCGFNDVSRSVVFDRQMNLLESVAMRAAGAASLEDACTRAAWGMAEGGADIPFAAIYLVDERTRVARLAASAGLAHAYAALPHKLSIGGDCPWPFTEVLAASSRSYCLVALDESTFGPLPSGPWSRPPREAVMTRLASPRTHGHVVLIAALNPFRVVADDAHRFIGLVSAQVAAGICNARS